MSRGVVSVDKLYALLTMEYDISTEKESALKQLQKSSQTASSLKREC